MATPSQRKASNAHRRRIAGRGLTRLEVQAPLADVGLIKAVARTLQGEPAKAKALRTALESALAGSEVRTAFDVFGSDLPDEVFAEVFEQPRQDGWRRADL